MGSRSSSGASRSSVANSMSRAGSSKAAPTVASTTINARSTTLPRTANGGAAAKPRATSVQRNGGGSSFMKPTAASAKKVLATSAGESQQTASGGPATRKGSFNKSTTSSRITNV